MSFQSILFPAAAPAPPEPGAPPYFADLNLDQVVDSITAAKAEYHLEPFFHARLTSVDAIAYRHEVFGDLEREDVFAHITAFADRMREMRKRLSQAERLRYRYEKEAWFLDAARTYLGAVARLADDLARAGVRSRGLRAFRDFLARYVDSEAFTGLLADADEVSDGLSGITYCLNISGSRIKVSRYESEADYSAEVERTFEKFKQGAVKDYRAEFPVQPDMNHVEAGVVELVARLFPDEFAALDTYCERHREFVDETIGAFDREVQFYVAYLEYVRWLRAAGLAFCYPRICERSKEVCAHDTFDIALANTLVPERSPVVCNDFRLDEPERIIVVSGPNQGGKTTFARTFGQLHHLGCIGCPVPGTDARLHLIDQLFTHFEKEEDIASLSGKLEDDLIRIHAILQRASGDSVVVMNESFTSTTLKDAVVLGTAVMRQMIDHDLLCVYVTFVDELASLGDTTVSMVSTIVPEDPASRTYKIVRRPADGLAYAAAIARKYGLTYERLRERVPS